MNSRLIKAALAAGAGTALIAAGTAAATAQPTGHRTFTITSKISRHTIVLDHRVSIRGTVTPTYTGQKVHLQDYVKNQWQTVASRKVSSGKYFFRTSPTKAGTWIYRVTTDAHRTRRAASSRTMRVNVYRWHYIADMQAVSGGWNTGSAEINGTNYPHSISGYNDWDGAVGYNLSRKCFVLTGVAGLDDTSGSGDSYDMQISGDGNTLLDTTQTLGTDQPFKIKVSSVLRLTFDATFLSGPQNNDDYPSYGTPRILCQF